MTQDFNIKFVVVAEKHQELFNYRLTEYARKDVRRRHGKR